MYGLLNGIQLESHLTLLFPSMYVGVADSFQDVELGMPLFSDIALAGEDQETVSSTSLKSEANGEQSQTIRPSNGVSYQR